MSGERGRQGFSLTWRSNSQMNWSSFLEEIPQCSILLWLVTSSRRCAQHLGFIDKY